MAHRVRPSGHPGVHEETRACVQRQVEPGRTKDLRRKEMDRIFPDVTRYHRRHAPRQVEPDGRGTACCRAGQAGIQEPGRKRQGPHWVGHDRSRRAAGVDSGRHADRGTHEREHGHCPGLCLRRQEIPPRSDHAGNHERGKEKAPQAPRSGTDPHPRHRRDEGRH